MLHPASPKPHRWRQGLCCLTVSFLALTATILLQDDRGVTRDTLPGAYHALSDWGDSRAYPGIDIPPAAYSLAYEYSRNVLRRPVDGAAAGVGWQPLGPVNGGGRTLAIVFHPDDPDIVYAGSASGGLWVSLTGGVGAEAWTRIDTGHPVLGVSTIAFEPGNADVMYIGTGEVYNHQAAGNLEADRATRGSYGIGILKSVDGGATWSKSLDWSYSQQHGVWAVRVDPLDPTIVWAATTDGVYKSIDSGASWSQSLDVIMATDLVVHPQTPDTVLAACGNFGTDDKGIYRTINGGDEWTLITDPDVPTTYQGKIQFGVTVADPDVVYASIGNGFTSSQGFTWLLRSDDFGATFELRSEVDYSRWQGWFAHDVAVSPVDPDTIICIGIETWRSIDGGLELTLQSDAGDGFDGVIPPGGPEGTELYTHADQHDVIFHPTDPDTFYVATDGGVFRSLDLGETYSGVNGGYQTQQFYNGSSSSPTDPNRCMGGLQDNNSAIYVGNNDWARGVFGGDGGWCALHPTDADIVYATLQFLYVGRSLNGGVNFSVINPPALPGPAAFISPFLMSPADSNVLYGGESYLFRSPDGGDGWDVMNGGKPLDGAPILVMAASTQDVDVVYMGTTPFDGRRGHVYRTDDGGVSFTDITGTLPDRFPGDMTVDPNNHATVYLTLSGFGSSHVFKSVDSGVTWIDIDGGQLPDVPTSAAIVDPDHPDHLYIGNDLGVYFTDDEGATWTQFDDGLPEAVLVGELGISPSNRKLRAFTHGLGLYERDLIEPGCPADVDGDGEVDVTDLTAVIIAWGVCPGCPEDVDGDGLVNVTDLTLVITSWGVCP
jgi:photosystem II stability/assembly factor-like uncharacterized protein